MTVSDQPPELVTGVVKAATRTLAAAQAVTDLAMDIARQALSPAGGTGRSSSSTRPPALTPSTMPAGPELFPSAEALQELERFLAERPYWSRPDHPEAAQRRLQLGILIGGTAASAGRRLAVHELVGLAYELERQASRPRQALPPGDHSTAAGGESRHYG